MTENVKIYTPEEQESLGLEFNTQNTIYKTQYDQSLI